MALSRGNAAGDGIDAKPLKLFTRKQRPMAEIQDRRSSIVEVTELLTGKDPFISLRQARVATERGITPDAILGRPTAIHLCLRCLHREALAIGRQRDLPDGKEFGRSQ